MKQGGSDGEEEEEGKKVGSITEGKGRKGREKKNVRLRFLWID